jgi:methyltransferase (TIGR00027 family)
MVAVRTRLIDELLQEAIARGVDTVVNLGAGLDTRPYRMHLPSTLSWVEVDYPDVIAFKEQQLATETPRCRLERIAVDLVQAPARRAMLAQLDRRGGRMLILTEGVVPYLDLQAVGALAEELRALDHLEGWLVDYVSPQALAFRKRTRIGRQMGQAQFKFDPADWFAFFADRGWRAREIRYLVAEGKRWGRRAPLPWPMRLLMRLLARLARPEARERFARFSAYVLLEADRTARS